MVRQQATSGIRRQPSILAGDPAGSSTSAFSVGSSMSRLHSPAPFDVTMMLALDAEVVVTGTSTFRDDDPGGNEIPGALDRVVSAGDTVEPRPPLQCPVWGAQTAAGTSRAEAHENFRSTSGRLLNVDHAAHHRPMRAAHVLVGAGL